MSKLRMKCRTCGSESVLADAFAEWNYEEQRREIQNTFEKGAFCEDCESETILDEMLTCVRRLTSDPA